MLRAFKEEEVKLAVADRKQSGLFERAIHKMKARETFTENQELVERGSTVTAGGEPILSNVNIGVQVIDPRTPQGFGNPMLRQIKQEQSITVNNLLSELEEKVLAVAASTGDNIRASVNGNLMGGLGWLPVLTSGEMSIPTRYNGEISNRNAEFMALFETTKNKIIRRICNSCPDDDYKDIYYRRLTSVNNRKLLNMLRNGHFDLSEYHGVTNVCFQDFTLHSTYEDAKAGTNQWQYCHPLGPGGKNGVGFPSYSGPTDHNIDNMNNGHTGENPDFAFYVEDSPWEPIRGKGKFVIPNPSKARDKRLRFDELFYDSRHKIARRICADCSPNTYKDVYYRRIDDSVSQAMGAQSINGLAGILWGDFQPYGVVENVFNVDFKIYSSYEDAINDNNPWEYCEWLPPRTYGFPGTCKPNRSHPNRETAGNTNNHVALYTESVVEPENIDVWMTQDDEMDFFFFKDDAEILPECKETGKANPNNIGDSGIIASLSTSIDEFFHSPQWFTMPFVEYDGSRSFCQNKGLDLCPRAIVCPNGANNPPVGGTKAGDYWLAIRDEHNSWMQGGTWTVAGSTTNAETCTEHEERHGFKPLWGLNGGVGAYRYVVCCGVGENVDYDLYGGWYDVHRCGECHDYCFWMSDPNAVFDPTFRPGTDPWHTPIAYNQNGVVKGYFTCNLSGTPGGLSTDLSFLVNEEGVTTFPYRKCEGKGAPTLKYRTEEYMGCWRMGGTFPVGISGELSFALCADACRSKGYHYFGRKNEGECRCGGVTRSDILFQMHGRVDYGLNYCKCDSPFVSPGNLWACVYRLVDQWDPDTARNQHKCYHLPVKDMRKLCYTSCRDVNESLTNMFMCKTLQATSLQHLNRNIAKWYDANSGQLHLLGGDVPGAGTF